MLSTKGNSVSRFYRQAQFQRHANAQILSALLCFDIPNSEKGYVQCVLILLRAVLISNGSMIEFLRVAVDLMHLFFVIDEYTDVECEREVQSMMSIASDALRDPGKARPEGEIFIGEMTRQ